MHPLSHARRAHSGAHSTPTVLDGIAAEMNAVRPTSMDTFSVYRL